MRFMGGAQKMRIGASNDALNTLGVSADALEQRPRTAAWAGKAIQIPTPVSR